MSESFDLSQPAKQAVFARLVGVSQPAINKQVDRGVLTRGGSYEQWILEYTEHLRSGAAGRGGSQQESLAAAKTEEAIVKTATLRLAYNKELEETIYKPEARAFLIDWAAYANREFLSVFDNFVLDIESRTGTPVPAEVKEKHAGAAANRVKSYALKLGGAGGSGGGEVRPAEEGTDL
jgi:hypothetical protein